MPASFLLLAGILSSSPTLPPKGWIEVAPPASRSEWQCANYSTPERAVSGGTGAALDIRDIPVQAQPTRKLELFDGVLTGTDRGEWGGSIEWQAKGARKRVRVHEANTQALFARRDEVFALTGLAHLTGDHGELLRLSRSGNTWHAQALLDLGSAPHASCRVDEDHVLVATGRGVLMVDLGKASLERLHHNGEWWNIYPNSIRPFGDAIALGARGAVIVLRRESNGYTEHWWVPAQCRQPGKTCACAMPGMDVELQ